MRQDITAVTGQDPAKDQPSEYEVPGRAIGRCRTSLLIVLQSGGGACTLAATEVPVGTVQFTAIFGRSTDFAKSAVVSAPLTVSKASTATALSLSPAIETYGDEQTELVSATVVPQYGGTPDGTVTVTSGSTTICTITLASGTGSCTMTATKLPAGTRTLTAVYAGSGDFTGSTSAGQTLTVAK